MRRFTDKQRVELYKSYKQGTSVQDLAMANDTHVQTIYTMFVRNNLARDAGPRPRTDIDEHYFDSIDTGNKAYILGLLLADGHFSKNGVHLKLVRKDAAVLQEINHLICSEPKKLSTDGGSLKLSIHSKVLATKLRQRLGAGKTERLARTIDVPDSLFGSFVRGFFDGDGTVAKRAARPSQRQVSLCSVDVGFLNRLRLRLSDLGIASETHCERRAGKLLKTPAGMSMNTKDMYRLVFSTHEARVKLYELMYHDPEELCIPRKFEEYSAYYANAVQILAAKKPRLSETEIRELYTRYLSGESMRSLAREIGRCNTVLRHWFTSLGLNTSLRNA
jgi:transposase-like protein